MGARVGGLRARLVWEGAARGALAACAAERRALCAAGQRGGGVGAHARRIGFLNTARPRGGFFGRVGVIADLVITPADPGVITRSGVNAGRIRR